MPWCLFCLDPLNLEDDINKGDEATYQNILKCISDHMNGRTTFLKNSSLTWNYRQDFPTPFCKYCLKSSTKLYRVSQQLTELKSTLDKLIEGFSQEIQARVAKNGGNVKIEPQEINEDNLSPKKEIISEEFLYSEGNSDRDSYLGNEDDPNNIEDDPNDNDNDTNDNDTNDSKDESSRNIVSTTKKETRRRSFRVSQAHVKYEVDSDPDNSCDYDTSHVAEFVFNESSDSDENETLALASRRVKLKRKGRDPPKLRDAKEAKKTKEQGNVSCDICDKTFASEWSLKQHLRHKDTIHNENTCSICQKKYKTAKHMRMHMRIIHGPKEFGCTQCDYKSASKKLLEQHYDCHIVELNYMCDVCGKAFKTENRANQHKKLVHVPDNSFGCDQCGTMFKTDSGLRRHVESQHLKNKKFVCPTCGKTFVTKDSLKGHEETHKNESERIKYKCEICGDKEKSFLQHHEMLRHQSIWHTVHTVGILTCHKCLKNFADGEQMARHSLRKSERDNCPNCDETFGSLCNLFVHHGETHPSKLLPHQCQQCSCVFSFKGLRNHLCRSSTCSTPNYRDPYLENEDDPNDSEDESSRNTPSTAKKEPTRRSLRVPQTKVKYEVESDPDNDNSGDYDTNQIPEVDFNESSDSEEDEDETLTSRRVKLKRNGRDPRKQRNAKENKTKEQGTVSCNICNKTFVSELSLNKHLRHKDTVHNENTTCSICQKKYKTAKHMRTHMRIIHGPKQFECTKCDYKSASKKLLEQHYDCHIEEFNYMCDVCGKAFKTENRVNQHKIFVHAPDKSFGCDQCGTMFKTDSGLRRHVEIRHLKNKRCVCPTCGKTFVTKDSLIGHQETHKSESERIKHKCEICGDKEKSFLQHHEMLRHQSIWHTVHTVGILTCHRCLKKFADGEQMARHSLRKSKRDNCPNCEETFGSLCNLFVHHGEKHPNGLLPHQCPQCSCVFSFKGLRYHLFRSSTCSTPNSIKLPEVYSEQEHMCETCGKVYISLESLKNHVKSHTQFRDPNACPCSFCGKGFPTQGRLNNHVRKVHFKNVAGKVLEKYFTCDTCGDSFQTKTNLICHQRIHTGEKQYLCPTCGRDFLNMNKVQRHILCCSREGKRKRRKSPDNAPSQ